MKISSIITSSFLRPYLICLGLWCTLFLLYHLNVFRALDYKAINKYFESRGTIPNSGKVVIVGIDQESFDRIEDPILFWNGYFATVLRHLSLGGARVIGFDLIQNKTFDKYIADKNQELLETVNDILEAGKTKLVFTYFPDKNLYPYEILLYTLTEYGSLGFSNLTVDHDDIIRRQLLYGLSNGTIAPSFALNTCTKYFEREYSLQNGTLLLGDQVIPASSSNQGTILINFAGSTEDFQCFSFIKVLEKANNGDIDYFSRNFKDKIVLIGVVTGEDRHFTAFMSAKQDRSLMSGVLIHANTIETILQGNFISEYTPFMFAGLPFLISLLLLCFLYQRISLPAGVSMMLLLLISGYFFSQYLFKRNLLFYYPVAGIGLFLQPLILYSYNYLKERKEKERVKRIFSSYLNPHVLEDLLKRDNSFLFDVKKRKIAILFSDVRDFTTISQLLEPDEIALLLSEYNGAMFEAIFTYNGTLHLYIGDGIMALWGAPVPDNNCCLNAVRSAALMIEKLKPLNEKWSHNEKLKTITKKLGRDSLFKIGIGIHYAEVVVGYIGPQQRMQYTAIGDGVNTASRVEGLNKKFNSEFLITEECLKEINEYAETKYLGPTPVKGRDKPVEIYQVLSFRG